MKKIVLKNVAKNYRVDSTDYKVLKGIDLEVSKGELVLIAGKSGSGKSTLLNMLTGIDSPTDGSVNIFGTDIHNMDSSTLAKWRGRNVGVVFQFFQLMPTLNVLENVMLPMELTGAVEKKARKEMAMNLLEKVGIADLAKKFPQSISGGEKQRVAIARALANNPELIIADEPTGNLDTHNTKNIQKLFGSLVDEGKTIIYVTHEKDFHFEYSRKIEISDGKISNIIAGNKKIKGDI